MNHIARIHPNTPANMPPDLLNQIFVQRERLLQQILDRLAISMSSNNKHHILLVGAPGIGKTHLAALAVARLKQNPHLADSMRIAWLGEEDAFSGLIHLAIAIAQDLADSYPSEFPRDFKAEFRGLPHDDAALAILHRTLQHLHNRHLLLVTENLDQTLQGIGDSGQKKLRAFLQETRRIATLTTATQLFNDVSNRNQPFFGFFDIKHLAILSQNETALLLRKIATAQKNDELLQFLDSPLATYRINALHHLAAGNPRVLTTLAEFLTPELLDDTSTALERLAESILPRYQEQIRSLPNQQRQLIQTLCRAPGAITVKEVAEETFIPVGNCSKQLGNLKSKQLVRSEQCGKESYYELADPLMRLCLNLQNRFIQPFRKTTRFLKAWFHQTMPHQPDPPQDCIAEYVPNNYHRNLIASILARGPAEWRDCVAELHITCVHAHATEQLARELTQSIAVLDQGDFSNSQLNTWLSAWNQIPQPCDDLHVPLQCLVAAINVLKAPRPTPRPLFQLPLEIRQIVRPLLRNSQP